MRELLHVGGGGGTGDNLNQLTSNGSLTLTVVQNLEPVESVKIGIAGKMNVTETLTC